MILGPHYVTRAWSLRLFWKVSLMIRSWYIEQSERETSAPSKCYTTNIYPGGVLLCRSFIKMSCRLSEPDQCPMQWIQGQKTRVLGGGSKGPLSPFNWSKMGLSNIIYLYLPHRDLSRSASLWLLSPPPTYLDLYEYQSWSHNWWL